MGSKHVYYTIFLLWQMLMINCVVTYVTAGYRTTRLYYVGYNEPCTETNQCLTINAICTGSKCQCSDNHYLDRDFVWYKRHICKQKIGYNELCTETHQCSTINAVCVKTYYSGRCQCVNGHRYSQEENACKRQKEIAYDGHCTKPEQCSTTNAICSDGGKCKCSNDHHYNEKENMCKPKVAYNGYCTKPEQCSTTNAICSDGGKCKCSNDHHYNENGNMCKPKPVSAYILIAEIVGGAVAVIVVLVFVCCIIMKRRKTTNGVEETTPTHIYMNDIGAKPDDTNPRRFVPKAVKLADFADYVKYMHNNVGELFEDAFQLLRRNSPAHACNDAANSLSKNRYANIRPFDHSRVKLQPLNGIEGSDYINANYIPGYTSQCQYIATQGPMIATFDDFWRMVWEQNVENIVMLTALLENDKRKCDQYWPDLGESTLYGEVRVSTESELNYPNYFPNYIVRQYQVSLKNTVRTIHQICFLKWPSMGCPKTPELLLQFIEIVGKYSKPSTPGPMVVHCSAGVGSTGTFIAVDHVLQHIRHNDEVDIYKLVLNMRNYRVFMVQNESQFIYIYECIKSYILNNK